MVDFDAFYAALEERFRGASEIIKERFQVYIPIVTGAGTGSHLGPVLDLGSGRGEWLELLREHGVMAEGIDQNAHFAEMSRSRGLDVEVGDILDTLGTKPADHYGAVTAFHVIEHLAPPSQLELLAGARRVLTPGGVLILEWPNIQNLRIATYNFWLDPTHLRPLPIELVRFMAEFSGFVSISVRRFREGQGVDQTVGNSSLARLARRMIGADCATATLNEMLVPGMDVALIARKAV